MACPETRLIRYILPSLLIVAETSERHNASGLCIAIPWTSVYAYITFISAIAVYRVICDASPHRPLVVVKRNRYTRNWVIIANRELSTNYVDAEYHCCVILASTTATVR